MKKIFLIFLFWFLIVNFFALLTNNRFNLAADTAYGWINTAEFKQTQGWDPIPVHAKWDSSWYLDIAQNGYSYNGPQKLSNLVFFPLYPLLIKAFSLFTAGNLVLSGWILSSIFLLLSLIYLFKLVKDFHPDINPYLPIIFLLIFPTAFFLNAIYTESLFLFLSLMTFYYGLKKKYSLAGVFGLLSALTRVTGVLLFIPLAWEYWKDNKFKILSFFKKGFLPLFLLPAGLFSFFLFHYLKFGDFLLFFKIESWWGRFFSLNRDHFILSNNPEVANFSLDLFFAVFILIVIFFVFKRMKTSYGLYMLATVAVAISSGTLMSIGRYILTLFPIYILLASIKNDYLQKAWIFLSILLLAMNIILFANNYWAG